MEITRIDELSGMGARKIVELSGWNEKPFVCELKRVGMYEMMAAGSVPNPLIPVVQDLFMGMQKLKTDMADAESAGAFVAIAKAAMANPTHQELTDAGLQLTDAQILEIFFFATRGPAALAAFRGRARAGAVGNDANVQDAAQRTAEDSR